MKKSIILISIFIITSVLVYPHSLSLGVYIPLGGNIPSIYQNNTLNQNLTLTPKTSFEGGIIFNPRVIFNIDDYSSINTGIDIGWYRDVFKFITDSENFSHEFDNLMLGLNLSYTFSFLLFGIGGGVKFPLIGKYSQGGYAIGLEKDNFAVRFNKPFIPYVRLYLGADLAYINLTFFVNFDIPNMQIKNNLGSLGVGYKYPGTLSSIDMGAQIALYFDVFKFGENK